MAGIIIFIVLIVLVLWIKKSQSERAGCGFSTTAGYYQR